EGEVVPGRGADEILLDEAIQQRGGVTGQIRAEGGDSVSAEAPPEDRAELQDPSLLGVKEVESSLDGRLNRVGKRRERLLDAGHIAPRDDAFPVRFDGVH